ncbi:MAG: ABC transporter permease [Planctomycetota bacterium]
MRRVLQVAWREFASTVFTKGFIIGVAIVPVIMIVLIGLMPLLMSDEAPKVVGSVAVIDKTNAVLPGIESRMTPEAILRRQNDSADRVREAANTAAKETAGRLGLGEDTVPEIPADTPLDMGEAPEITIEALAADADLEQAKTALLTGDARSGGRLAIVVLEESVVTPDEQGDYGAYDLFLRERLDDRVTNNHIQPVVRQAIREARFAATGDDYREIGKRWSVTRGERKTVTAGGETEGGEIANMLLPMGAMLLLFISVFTGGSYLMTTTIEEKSSRVVELLLSAVSPMQLMTGKVIGQMGVGALLMLVYGGVGIGAITVFNLVNIEPSLIVYLLFFFVIAYFIIGSFMAAIGAAVNELREAQALQTPVMMVAMVPWILWLPISRDPNSVFATTLSFVPPVNPFVMILRLTSTEPPPAWQVWVSIVIGLVSAWLVAWAAAKVFRVGILLHGKPPSFGTLIKWVRMA